MPKDRFNFDDQRVVKIIKQYYDEVEEGKNVKKSLTQQLNNDVGHEIYFTR